MPNGSQPVVWPGRPYPLGTTWDGEGVNFALYSEHAERVDLCLFDTSGRREMQRVPLPEQTDMVWHGYLPEVRPGQLYGYRVYGPYAPEQGHRFNHHKLLLDPYGKQVQGFIRWSDAHFAYKIGNKQEDLSFDRRDDAAAMPKNKVIDSAFTWGADAPPRIPWHDTVIYELHVKGFTMSHPDVPAHLRGTYHGSGDRVPHPPGSDLDRIDACPQLHRRSSAHRARIAQLLGVQLDRIPRARAAIPGHELDP